MSDDDTAALSIVTQPEKGGDGQGRAAKSPSRINSKPPLPSHGLFNLISIELWNFNTFYYQSQVEKKKRTKEL